MARATRVYQGTKRSGERRGRDFIFYGKTRNQKNPSMHVVKWSSTKPVKRKPKAKKRTARKKSTRRRR